MMEAGMDQSQSVNVVSPTGAVLSDHNYKGIILSRFCPPPTSMDSNSISYFGSQAQSGQGSTPLHLSLPLQLEKLV